MGLFMFALLLDRAEAGCGCEDGRVIVDGVEAADLASALASASAGAWIEVCAGTYTGPFTATVPVSLIALEGPELTVLDGAAADTVLALPGDSSVIGFTITNGASATHGGGIRLTSAGALLLDDDVITGNTAAGGGGLSVPDGATVYARSSRITGNSALEGGGILAGSRALPGVPNQGILLEIWDTTVSENTAAGEVTSFPVGGAGGGISAYDTRILGGWITGNRADSARLGNWFAGGVGGGLLLFGASSLVWTEVTDNVASDGGGVMLRVSSEVVLDGAWIEGNTADGVESPSDPSARIFGEGGGVYAVVDAQAGPLSVRAYDTTIRGNTANTDGGGVAIRGRSRFDGSSFGIDWSGGRIVGNLTRTGSGGGVKMSGGVTSLTDAVVKDNLAAISGGGALVGGGAFHPSLFGEHAVISGCTFADNVAQGGVGGGLKVDAPSVIVDTAITRNHAPSGGGVALYGFGDEPSISHALERVTVSANQASASGGGLQLALGAEVALVDSSVEGNVAPVGGGVEILDAALTSSGTVWGACAPNAPEDVWVEAAAAAYPVDGDFGCTAEGCSP